MLFKSLVFFISISTDYKLCRISFLCLLLWYHIDVMPTNTKIPSPQTASMIEITLAITQKYLNYT